MGEVPLATRVFVNSTKPDRRKRFTLGHEYGHIRIPWHMGTIADVLDDEEPAPGSYNYWRMEEEANRFASELLLPRAWLRGLAMGQAAAEVQRAASDQADVSRVATAIGLIDAAPPGWLYARVVMGTIRVTGRSPGTLTTKPPWGTPLDEFAPPPGAIQTSLED